METQFFSKKQIQQIHQKNLRTAFNKDKSKYKKLFYRDTLYGQMYVDTWP